MKQYDYLIVGSGLFGATFAYFARLEGKRCLVIDKRQQVGGNVYCEKIEGINVHKYGAHIFHTSNKKVWDFVNSLVEFNRYTNAPVACWKDHYYNLPFNMNTFNEMWGVHTPREAEAKIEAERQEVRRVLAAAGVTEPRNLEEQAQLLIGKTIYERLIKGYTEKQWGRPCTELPAFIIRRLPIRLVYDNNYFNDAYQGIPKGGYNRLIDKLLASPQPNLTGRKDLGRIDVLTGVDFFVPLEAGSAGAASCREVLQQAGVACHRQDRLKDVWRQVAEKLVYTGPLDEYFDDQLGRLQWRTVRFETTVLDEPNHQGNAVINYTEASVPYTRVIEHKHFECFGEAVYANPKTVISKEYSTEWKPGMEPYYPINDAANNALADRYRALAAAEPDVCFGGRLAEYKYYDMAPVIEKVMGLFGK
jgi:UDP-galactopyranose mutase